MIFSYFFPFFVDSICNSFAGGSVLSLKMLHKYLKSNFFNFSIYNFTKNYIKNDFLFVLLLMQWYIIGKLGEKHHAVGRS